MKRIYFGIAIVSAILFGAASPLTKPLLETFSPFQLAGLLYLRAAIGVCGLIIREKKFFLFKDFLPKKGWIAVVGTIFAAIVLAWGEGPAGWLAGLFIILATLSWGMDNHFTALIDGISPAQSTFWKGIIAGTVNRCFSFSGFIR